MKKLIALAAATLLSAAVFAENTFHVGAYIPINSWTIEDGDNEDDFKSGGFGGFFDFTHVADSGFSVKVNLGVGYAHGKDDLEDFKGVDFDLGVGLGGSPIHNEKMTLSIFGDLGFRIDSLGYTESVSVSGYTADIEFDLFNFNFYIGPEIAYTFRFNDHVGIFANFGILYNVGACTLGYDAEGITDDESYFLSGFTFQPKFGVAFTL